MLNVQATLVGPPHLLAQPVDSSGEVKEKTEEKADAEKKDGDGGGGGMGSMMWIMIFGMVILWVFLLGGGSRKQKKRQQQMLSTMSKGDKIVTIGGIRGSVVEVRESEVIVKVDENSNTRMRFSRDAIRSVIDESAGKDGDGGKADDKDKDKDKDS